MFRAFLPGLGCLSPQDRGILLFSCLLRSTAKGRYRVRVACKASERFLAVAALIQADFAWDIPLLSAWYFLPSFQKKLFYEEVSFAKR